MGKPELLDVIPRDYPVPKPWVLRPISENQFQRDDHNDTDSSHVPLKVYNQALQPCHDEEERKKKRAEKRYPYLIQRFDSYSKHLRTQHQLETKPPRRWSISVDSRIAERLGLFAYQQDEPLSTLNTTSAEGEGEGEGEAEGRRQKAEGEREPAKAGRRERERRRSTGRR